MTFVQFFNQYSFLIYSSLVLGGWLIVLIARRAHAHGWLVWTAAAALALGIYFVMRTAAPLIFESAADVQRAVSVGTPRLVEFYSDF